MMMVRKRRAFSHQAIVDLGKHPETAIGRTGLRERKLLASLNLRFSVIACDPA